MHLIHKRPQTRQLGGALGEEGLCCARRSFDVDVLLGDEREHERVLELALAEDPVSVASERVASA